jgi:hypothetical protein
MLCAEGNKTLISDGKIVLLALIGGMVAFAIAFFFISGGMVRHVYIFLPESHMRPWPSEI